ncbi:MAG: hypothetical protein JJU21_04295 [Salinarimonas sp.]|nr:hypothetical protein [Salinarimonas sp.]
MSVIGRFAFATLCGLVLAAIAHVGVILLLPFLSERAAFTRLQPTHETGEPILVAGPQTRGWLSQHDPSTALTACAYDLSEAPLRVTFTTGSHFQSAAFHGRGAGAFFAITDRAIDASVIDVLLMTPEQRFEEEALSTAITEVDDTGEIPIDPLEGVLRVTAPEAQGFVAFRVLAPLTGLAQAASERALSARCTPFPLDAIAD